MATTITYKGSDLTSFSNTSKTLRTAGKYLEGDITITAGADVNNQNKTVIPSETTQSIIADTGYTGLGTVTVNGITNTYVGSSVPRRDMDDVSITYDSTTNEIKTSVSRGYYDGGGTTIQSPQALLPYQSATTIIPSETAQTAVDINKWTTGTVTVAAITPTYVGSSVPAGSLTVSGPTVTASAGYYANAATETIPDATFNKLEYTSGSPILQVDSSGLVSSNKLNFGSSQRRLTNSAGYVYTTTNFSWGITVPSGTLQLPTQAATTVIPSESTTTITGQKYMTGDITVAAITPTYVGSEITTNPTITVSGRTVTIPAGYYDSDKEQAVNKTMVASVSGTSTGVLWNTIRVGYTQTYINFSEGYNDNARYARVWSYAQSKTVTPTTQTQTVEPDSSYDTLRSVTVNPIPSQYIVPSGTLTITSVDTTTTFNAASYASVAVNLKNADVIYY